MIFAAPVMLAVSKPIISFIASSPPLEIPTYNFTFFFKFCLNNRMQWTNGFMECCEEKEKRKRREGDSVTWMTTKAEMWTLKIVMMGVTRDNAVTNYHRDFIT